MFFRTGLQSKNCEVEAFTKGEEENSMKTIPVMFPKCKMLQDNFQYQVSQQFIMLKENHTQKSLPCTPGM